ncbi:MAG: hypothetical protein ACP5XB_05125 [Isosphaeraceae bacterium]
MRCTRCEGLAVPQAVGIHPDGRVVFGWCLSCLVRTNCRIVEIPETGPTGLKLDFKIDKRPGLPESQRPVPRMPVDQSRWIIALVSFLMISWGLILLAAGLFSSSRAFSGGGSPDHFTPPMLGIGDASTALLGLGLMVLAAHRDWLPGTFVLVLLSWLSFGSGLGILAYAALDYQPSRNVPILLGAGLAVFLATVSRLLERSQRGKTGSLMISASLKPAVTTVWLQAGEMNRLN